MNLAQLEQELADLKEEYQSYRKIVETNCNNKKVKDIKRHVSWMTRDELNQKAKEVAEEEALEYQLMMARQRNREGRRREGRREREEKKRAAERKALDELMEKEMKERRNRKNTGAN